MALTSYDEWRDVGLAIKSTYDTEKGFELFNSFSHINTEKYDKNIDILRTC